MFDALKTALLRLLNVPAEPDAPIGHAGSLKVFRAAPNYFRYKLFLWALGQVISLIALAVVVAAMVGVGAQNPEGIAGCALTGLFAAVILLILGQLVLSFFVVRLDFEMRWYLVTDQSLRIREGVVHVREMTMTFANIQNISVSQGPLQRLLGVADLEVKSAGGGGVVHPRQQQAGMFSMHTGYFRGVDNAEELRDLMRARMKKAKGSGLGDPDDHEEQAADAAALPAAAGPDLAAVLAEMRGEARALRGAAERLSAGRA